MEDCIFCMIAQGKIPSKKAYEDETVLAFYDVNPQAPTHILVIPKEHIGSLMELKPEQEELLAHMMEVVQIVAKEAGIDKTGFRLVSNVGKDGQQSVPHLHFHVVGGRSLQWPPG